MNTGEKFNKILTEKILIFDGAMGTYLGKFGLTPEDFKGHDGLNEYLSLSRPDVVKQVHLDYLAAGADVVETNTFGANRFVLAEYGLQDKVKELNLAAVKLAREAALAASTPEKPRYVAGSVGPTNKALFVTGGVTFDEFADAYYEQISALMDGGVDLLLVETAHDISNIKAALAAASKAFAKYGRRLPVIVSVTMDRKNAMLSGQDTEAVCVALEHFPLLALGFNCSTGPEDLALRLETLSKISRFPIFAMPNAGLPDENGKYNETPEEFAAVMKKYALAGLLNAAGGCCGTGPGHIRALAAALAGVRPRRTAAPGEWAVSGIEALFYSEIEPPLLVGERNNSIGSKKFRDIAAAGKWDEAVDMAKAQVRAGAHVLDVCLSNPERKELEDAKVFLPKLFHAVRAPVMIDTTDLGVMEEALKLAPGQCILNSVNFEFGEEKPRAAAGLVKLYGGKLVFGLIDEDKEKGIPITAVRKLEIARRGYEFFTKKCGLTAEHLIFDALVFPVGVGGEYAGSAHETLKALEQLKSEFPLSKTVLGVSNVSFGLPPEGREVLNAVFLHHAIKAGLGLAIVNIEKLRRYAQIPANELKLSEDLLLARTPDPAGAFAAYFRDKKKGGAPAAARAAAASPEERLYGMILDGSKAGARDAVKELLAGGMEPLAVINGPVLKAMGEVGRLFSKGDLIVTEVLQSAEVTKEAVSVLEPALKAGNIPKRGKFLLATVKGDVHDIGKNLVNIIFEANGFEVVDMGVKVPPEDIVAAALKEKPDFIGLSGLLVRSTEQMTITATELARAGVTAPLLAGGAALTGKFVETNMKPVYKGPVFYSPDAMDGLNSALNYLVASDQCSVVSGRRTEPAEIAPRATSDESRATNHEPRATSHGSRAPQPASRDKWRPDEIPAPKDFDRHFLGDCEPGELFAEMDEDLFNLRFLKLKKTDAAKTEDTKKIVDGIKAEVVRERLIRPRGVYRFFKASADGDSLLLYGADGKALETINFPRQHDAERLCIADFFAPHGGKSDYTALLAATCGEGVAEFARREREKGNYLRSYIVEALALSLAEAFAEVMHYRIRQDWGIAEVRASTPLRRIHYSGRRYSFGYPPCPDLSNQKKLFNLLKPEGDVGVKLTDGFMMDPEASVSAFVLHNPKAKYFTI
ncbi:MAG: methionine synthase [Elusimicrobia bacterium GWA2_56_46]|nr:MAG: methionine synthase [Elusimicrobia bacterium GWA2_56_46]OGR53957.1 MAG: methionine synthase [Elusimicrobia bacterium GWC2_56_31]HBB66072.1 methionine synthase [Elusimicrobiota bacterium]HBW22065.1 methionine synthase [Elusimicrobiota bacterium]